jgi:hypothetical protein
MGELDMQKGNRPARGKGPKLARAGVVLIVLIAVAAGGATVYRMPSACGVCHTPMAGYVEGYHGGDASLMITAHAQAEDTLVCLDCHESELRGDTVRGVRWVTGDYEFPLPKAPMGTRAFCLESGCHDEREILEETESLESAKFAGGTADYNPHDPRHGRQECSRCHTMHGKSVLMCSQCHDLAVPEGWVTPDVTGLVASR